MENNIPDSYPSRSLRRSSCRQPASPDPSAAAADFPPLSAVPFHIRPTYSKHMANLIDAQARIAELERLIRRQEREERRARYELYGEERQPPAAAARAGRMIASRKIVGKPGSPTSVVGPLQSSPLGWGWTAEDVEAEHNAVMGLNVPPLSPSESIWSASDESSSSSSSASSSEHGDDDVAIASPSDSDCDLDELLGAYAYTVVEAPSAKSAQTNAAGTAHLFGLGIDFVIGQAI
jgi:hypothetical protein